MAHVDIHAVIFDMDGVLIDSEPAWQQAEIKVFNSLGLGLTLAEVESTTGLRIDQVVEYWYQRRPWPNYQNAVTANAIVEEVVSLIQHHGQAMDGVINTLEWCKQHGFKIGLATSSPQLIIDAVLKKLQIKDYFNAITSAELLTRGKPHPEVYLNCAQALHIAPENCLAIEDSFNGLIAARAASMQTVAIPAAQFATQTKWVVAHHQLNNMSQLPELICQYD
ncbi:hexitol phosphatase HxpB [Shewanella gaetbuli]|uniref:Hexitol phosphatase HxpB n=1 Tax=Shewanella gaetbuli TaxID=220752 RepID=A0A9X1ZGS8_9GAMM|nr:hexitol phosphatase HxpB [Shewanella gaetbuli]MCL1142074.1 hexitol phosphatase HxpB [Shewanella gaetbuli]